MSAAGETIKAGRIIPGQGKLSDGLEAQYLEENAAARIQQYRFWILASLSFNYLMGVVGVIARPSEWLISVCFFFGLVNAVALGCLYTLSKPVPGWLKSIAAVATHSTALLTTLIVFDLSNDFDMHRSLMVLPFGIMLAHMAIPVTFIEATIFTLVTLLAGDAINTYGAVRHGVTSIPWDLVVFSHALALISTCARLLAERETRRSFAAGLDAQRRSDDLTRANARLLTLSSTDSLTGLNNRRAFDRAISDAWVTASIQDGDIGVAMIDVDHFKKYNDAAGHLEGDRCLVCIAGAITRAMPSEVLAARFGGEEFIVMLTGPNAAAIQDLGERVRVSVETLTLAHPGLPSGQCVSISVGVAQKRDAGVHTIPQLLQEADMALYESKSAGRNRVTRRTGTGRRPVSGSSTNERVALTA